MAKTRNMFVVTVSYPFKEYDSYVDDFVVEAFRLCGMVPCGTGTDFVSRDLVGYSDNEAKCLILMDYLHSCPCLDFNINYTLTKKDW